MSTIIAIDIGGTFTDLAAYRPDLSGRPVYAKRPTTHENLAQGVMACIEHANLDLHKARLLKHGTTLVINTLLERSGARVALLCTRGFRDTIEIGRGNIAEPYNLNYRRDAPLCDRPARFEVTERISGDGSVSTELDTAEIGALARKLEAEGYEAVAVSFLNSYRNASNEQSARREIEASHPNLFVTAGTDLSQEWYEFERTATAVANAYVGPRAKMYLRHLDSELAENGFVGRFLLMASNGGVLSPEVAEQKPLHLVESGPVGGCVGVARLARAMGIDAAIAFDMGGTTAKCALIEEATFTVERRYDVGGYERGLPVNVPVVDIVEVGAGGGSIAWLDEARALHVGPRSAGSRPGPAAYGWGGTEPTVSDANVVLGRLQPRHGLAGGLRLDVQAAVRAIDDAVTVPLHYTGTHATTQAALGIVAVASAIMAEAIKQITIERGRDPRDHTLFAYGGAGPLHACELARELNIPKVIVPKEAGNFSAAGMLMSEIRRDHASTYVQPVGAGTVPEMNRRLDELASQAAEAIRVEFGPGAIGARRFAELRYLGQHHTVTVPVDGCRTEADVRQAFAAAYFESYGHLNRHSDLEMVTLHVTVTATVPTPDEATVWSAPKVRAERIEPEVRRVVFGDNKEATICKVFDREQLPQGFSALGPAIVEEPGATTVVGPDDSFAVGTMGELILSIGPSDEAKA